MVNLKRLICDKSLSQRKLAEIIGTTQSEISHFANGRRPLLEHHLQSLIAYFGEDTIKAYTMDDDTLITSHITEASFIEANELIEIDIDALMREHNVTALQIATIVGEKADYIYNCNGKLLPQHIMQLEHHFGEEVVVKYTKFPKNNTAEVEVVEAFPIVPEAVVTDPNANIEVILEEDGSELETINPNLLLTNAKVDTAEFIKSTSMYPTFLPNDYVFIRFLKNKMKITDGNIYYLNCRNRPTMIRLVKFEGSDKLRLIAQNSQYSDIVIDRCDIINIGTVEALFRMTFGDMYSELESLRREKDEQLESRNEQINNFIVMQREMLAEIREAGKRNGKLIDKIMEDK